MENYPGGHDPHMRRRDSSMPHQAFQPLKEKRKLLRSMTYPQECNETSENDHCGCVSAVAPLDP